MWFQMDLVCLCALLQTTLKKERSCKEERNVELYILYNVEDALHNRASVIYTVTDEER